MAKSNLHLVCFVVFSFSLFLCENFVSGELGTWSFGFEDDQGCKQNFFLPKLVCCKEGNKSQKMKQMSIL